WTNVKYTISIKIPRVPDHSKSHGDYVYVEVTESRNCLVRTSFLSPYPSREISDHVYDELKKVLILAGAFFFITIVCVMSKLQNSFWEQNIRFDLQNYSRPAPPDTKVSDTTRTTTPSSANPT
ncbi:hypothetical protein OSTOST_03982, partial [Ostertagia ostertagi]